MSLAKADVSEAAARAAVALAERDEADVRARKEEAGRLELVGEVHVELDSTVGVRLAVSSIFWNQRTSPSRVYSTANLPAFPTESYV